MRIGYGAVRMKIGREKENYIGVFLDTAIIEDWRG